MKNKLLIGLFALFSLTAMSSCVKDKSSDYTTTTTTTTSMKDIVVPEDFNYNSTKSVSLTITVDDPEELSSYEYIAKVYNGDPDDGGSAIYSGTIPTDSYSLTVNLTVPSALDEVWIEVYLGNDLVNSYTETL